jgi:hypothetical protein
MAEGEASWVAGIYRSDLDDIVLIDRGLPADDIGVVSVFLHELVHALQDRSQDLPTWFDGRTDTYDGSLAALSVVEGEARMHQARFGLSLLGLDPNAVDLAKHFEGGVRLADQNVLSEPSPYLASYASFPYAFGARRLWPRFMQRGPQAIADLFAAPPRDTRAFLDPAGDADVPVWPAPAAPTPPPEWVLTHETTLGAWGTYLVLAKDPTTADADALARSWRGDRFWVYRGTGAAATTALVWRIAFADEVTAHLFWQRSLPRFVHQRQGAEVVVVESDAALPLDWAFEAPSQAASPPGDEGSQLATASSVGAWVSRTLKLR